MGRLPNLSRKMQKLGVGGRQLASTTLSSAPSTTAGQSTSLTQSQLTEKNVNTSSFPLLDLPSELVLIVFDNLREEGDWCTLTCLGLTCAYLYNTLKERYHPDPISLEHYVLPTLGTSIKGSRDSHPQVRRLLKYVPLVKLIQDFIGPKYRLLGGVFPPLFVCREIYGDEDDPENEVEQDLRGRLWDYRLMTYKDWQTGQTVRMLPRPFYKGADWYDEAFERARDFGIHGWTQDMQQYWRRNIRATHAAEKLCQRGPSYKAFWLWLK